MLHVSKIFSHKHLAELILTSRNSQTTFRNWINLTFKKDKEKSIS